MIDRRVIEHFASDIHNIWIEWSQAVSEDVSKKRLERWKALWVPFWDLPSAEKKSDRKIAEELLILVYPAIRRQIKSECWECDAPLSSEASGGFCSPKCRKAFFEKVFKDEIKHLTRKRAKKK